MRVVAVCRHILRMRLRGGVGLAAETEGGQAFLLPRSVDEIQGMAPQLVEIADTRRPSDERYRQRGDQRDQEACGAEASRQRAFKW